MTHPVDAYIGRRIREERHKAGLTQHELASQIGIKFQQVQKYETGANRVSGSRLWMTAKVLGVPVASLMPTDEQEAISDTHTDPGDALLMRDILRLKPELRREVVRLVRALTREQRE